MVKIYCGNNYYAVPRRSVTTNGIYLEHLNVEKEDYEGPFSLLMPDGKVAMGEGGRRPRTYHDIEECLEDASVLAQINKPLTTETAVAIRHYATPVNFLATQSCDIGEAKLQNGKRVFITWGRNISPKEARRYAHKTGFKPIKVSSSPYYELIFPDKSVKKMLLGCNISPSKWTKTQ